MGFFIGVPIVLLLAVLQSAVFSHLGLLEGRPDLVLLAVIAWSLAGRANEAMAWGFAGGLALDLLSGLPLGVSALSLVAIAYLASLTEGRFWEGHLLVPIGAALAGGALFHAVEVLALALGGHPIDLAVLAPRILLPSLFMDVILALPAFQAAGSLREALFPPKVTVG
jgi:rod shape-determining protein MreD